jgi:hypothetical protein
VTVSDEDPIFGQYGDELDSRLIRYLGLPIVVIPSLGARSVSQTDRVEGSVAATSGAEACQTVAQRI